MYEEFERKKVKVNIHSHDRNMSVNKAIKTKDGVRNCSGRWQATKPLSQGIKKYLQVQDEIWTERGTLSRQRR